MSRGSASWSFLVLAVVFLAMEGGRAPAAPAGASRAAGIDERETGPLFTWVDVDGRGRLDLVVLSGSGTLQLLANAGDGRFEDVTERLGLAGVADAALALWADYDGDGRLDLFVGAREGASRLFRRDGEGFTDMSAASGLALDGAVRSAQWLDLDGDGRLDLFAVSARGTELFHGVPGGFFERARLPLEGLVSAGGTAGMGAGAPGAPAVPGAPPSSRVAPPVDGARDVSVAGVPPGRIALGPTPTVGGATPLSPFPTACANSIRDQANPGTCIDATTTPTLGSLYPLSTNLFVDPTGKIGLGTTAPRADLDLVRSTSTRLRVQSALNQDATISLLENNAEIFGFDLVHRGTSNDFEIISRHGSSTVTRMAIDRATGAVGIGTIDTAPARLTVGGPGASLWITNTDSGPLVPSSGTAAADQSGIRIFNNSTTGLSTIQAWDYTTGVNAPRDLVINDSGGAVTIGASDFMIVHSNPGEVLIGGGLTPNSSYKVDINGAMNCTSVWVQGVQQLSSKRLKKDITPLEGSLDKILCLNGVSYTWNEMAVKAVQGQRDIGFIADEVNVVLPEIVGKDSDGRPIAIDYGKVTAVAVEAIKELKAKNDALEDRLARIEALLASQGSTK